MFYCCLQQSCCENKAQSQLYFYCVCNNQNFKSLQSFASDSWDFFLDFPCYEANLHLFLWISMSISCYFPWSTRNILYKICNLTFHSSPVGGRESNFWNCATQLFPAGKPLNHFSSLFFPRHRFLAPVSPQPAPASLTSRRLPLSFCSHTFGDAYILFCAINWA